MKSNLSLSAALILSTLSSLQAQGQMELSSISFEDHNGDTTAATSLNPLRTGTFVATANITGAQLPKNLTYAWGYYAAGKLITVGGKPFVFTPGPNQNKLLERVGGNYEIRIPYGYGKFYGLPIGAMSLRVWVGDSATLKVGSDATPVGVFATDDVPIQIQSQPFALFVKSPRVGREGGTRTAKVVTKDPVAADTLFSLKGAGVASPGPSQVLIKKGKTDSGAFEIRLNQPGEGHVVVSGMSMTVASSTILALSGHENTPVATDRHPIGTQRNRVEDWWAWCKQAGEWRDDGGGEARALGGEEEFCGDCSTAPAPRPAPECNTLPDQPRPFVQNGYCVDALYDECIKWEEKVEMPMYSLAGEYYVQCGSGSVTYEMSLQARLKWLELGGTVTGSENWTEKASCCLFVYAGKEPGWITKCKTVD